MQQIIFKRKYFFDAAKTENLRYLEEQVQPVKKIVTENIA